MGGVTSIHPAYAIDKDPEARTARVIILHY